jgi:hypothetical protein
MVLCLTGAMPPPGALVNVLPKRKAYASGEVLAYDINWSGIPAGRAVMSVIAGTDASGAKVDRLVSIVRSNKVVSVFYKVRDRVVRANGRASTLRPGRDPVTADIPPNAHDIISCLYYLRSLDGIEPGVTKIVDVHEGGKNWRLLVHAEKRERVTVPAGTFDTVRVRAEVRFHGVFFDRGDVRLWLTDDARHVPVRVSIKIKIGQVLADLVGRALPPLPPTEETAARGPQPIPMRPSP